MERKAVSGIVLMLLLTGVLTLAVNVQSIRADPKTIYVDASNVSDPYEDGSEEHPFDMIHEGIDAADSGDTVLVAAETYYENINFRGKAITVKSESGAENTIIDGGGIGSVVTLESGEEPESVLDGFTITNSGGLNNHGIKCYQGSATIINNIIRDNNGWGICLYKSVSVIRGNVVYGNPDAFFDAIHSVEASPVIEKNTILATDHNGNINAIDIDDSEGSLAQSFLISSNVIIGRIYVSVWSPISTFVNEISNNIIVVENLFSEAINVNLMIPSISDVALSIVNNVIHKGGGVFLQRGGENTGIVNNIITECNIGINSWSGYLEMLNNDLWDNGINYGGIPDQTGMNGNIAVDPMFVDAAGGDYHVQAGSPCIDAGTNEDPPSTDFDGNLRSIDGDGDGIAVADIGAFEFIPETRRWTVDDDGPADFHTIQEAINSPNVKDGDTIFVKAGTYFEKIIVNKSVSLIGENKDTTIIDGRGSLGPGVNVTSDKVTISGFTIQYCGDWYTDSGLLLYRCNDTLVAGNIIKNNVYSGIGLVASSDNNITNNIITNNPYFGVYLAESGNNNISDNVVSKNVHGIYFAGSGNNFLRDNHMQDNIYNFGVLGISLVDFIQNIDDSNTVEGKPICYFVNRHDERIPPDSGYVAIVNSTNMVVRDLKLTKNDNGLLLANTNSSIVENVTVTGNYWGIELWKSSGNTLSNSIASNNQAGIRMETSHSTSVSRNLISNNNQLGIGIVSGSASNIISENTISNNLGYGIFIIESEGNTIYDNNLFNNYPYVSTGYANIWDDGYPSGGNYWSDYEERYPDAEELGGSGLWDTPYVIDENNQDNYPLMHPWVTKITSTITIGGYPETVSEGSNVTISGAIAPIRIGVPVTIFHRIAHGIGPWTALATVLTDPDSKYAYNWTTTSAGTYELKTSWPGDAETFAAESDTIIVNVDAIEKPPRVVIATIDIYPETLNLRSRGKWITAYIELPEGYNPEDIDASTILLNGTISPVLDPKYGWVKDPSGYLVDHNNDGILERMVKFDRATVESFIYNQGIRYGKVALSITGKLLDGTQFEGTDTIFVNHAGDANHDGKVNVFDICMVKAYWGTDYPDTDFNKDSTTNTFDILILKANWDQTTR